MSWVTSLAKTVGLKLGGVDGLKVGWVVHTPLPYNVPPPLQQLIRSHLSSSVCREHGKHRSKIKPQLHAFLQLLSVSFSQAVGDVVGESEGLCVGFCVSDVVGNIVELRVGDSVGLSVVGDLVGEVVAGDSVGSEAVGETVGFGVGDIVGLKVGDAVGDTDGTLVVGETLGFDVGLADGESDGARVGASVHTLPPHDEPFQSQQSSKSQSGFDVAMLHSMHTSFPPK